jgi:hypothetical protein
MRPGTTRAVLSLAVVALAAGACTASGKHDAPSSPPGTVVTGTDTIVTTRTVAPPSSSVRPSAPASVAPLPSSGKAPKGEVKRTCPYLKAGFDAEPTSGPNYADIEGDRVGTVTVLTGLSPVGCRFYFIGCGYGPCRPATGDILPYTFATATEAHNAMVTTAAAGKNEEPEPDFAAGADGIRYRTKFFGPNGDRDWAFVFAKGRHMVIIHTWQTNASQSAQNLAEAIVKHF